MRDFELVDGFFSFSCATLVSNARAAKSCRGRGEEENLGLNRKVTDRGAAHNADLPMFCKHCPFRFADHSSETSVDHGDDCFVFHTPLFFFH